MLESQTGSKHLAPGSALGRGTCSPRAVLENLALKFSLSRMKQEAGRSQALSSPRSLSAALVLLATSLWALNFS